MTQPPGTFATRRQDLLDSIARTAQDCGRDAASIALMAVSKTQDAAAIDDALAAGQRLFGENKVQEAAAHWDARRTSLPDLRLHLIGPLQRNKAKEAVRLFDCIETIDRPPLIDALATQMRDAGRWPDCLIQVNLGDEPQKGGVALAGLPGLIGHARTAGLPLRGLMAVPPQGELAAPYFALLAKLARCYGLGRLSMGMSGDYRQAIRLGATTIRVGTALFGSRDAAVPLEAAVQ